MAASGLGSLDGKSIEGAISTFQETAKVVMQGLDALGNAHPFIAGQSLPSVIIYIRFM